MSPAVVDLAAELNALADASAEALARLQRGDETGVVELVERRERLLRVLSEWPLDAGTALREAARRARALDTELVTLLRGRQAQVGRQIELLTRARQSLESYGPTRSGSAIYIERLG